MYHGPKYSPKETAVQVMQDARNDKIIRDGKNFVLQRLFEGGFEIAPRKGALKITSHMLQQAKWKFIARMKMLDWTLHGSGQEQWKEKLMTDAVSTFLEKGHYNDSMVSKDGMFDGSAMWGDKWMMIGTNPKHNAEVPFLFEPISNSNIYFDPYATKMRGSKGRAVTKCVVIFSYSWETACQLYPKLKKEGAPGQVPRDMSMLKELERTYNQTAVLQGSDITEIAYLYDLDKEVYAVFGGPTMVELELHKGGDYPFEMDGEKYIPVINQMFMPSSAGIYNHGLLDMIYDYAVLTAELMNMAIGHAEDNIYPITMVNVPQGQASKFFNKLRTAHEMRQAGKKGYLAMESGAAGQNSAVASQLTTQSMWQEWEALYNTFTREVARLGINLDDGDFGSGMTEAQIMAEEASKSALAQQVQEYNASEVKFTIRLVLDFIKKFVKKNNKTPLELTTNYEVEGVEIRGDSYTYGDVADELRKHEYFVKVNSKSGANPSNIMQQTQASRILGMLPPGSKAWSKELRHFASLNDRELKEEDLGGGEGQGQPEGGLPPEGAGTLPTPQEEQQMAVA